MGFKHNNIAFEADGNGVFDLHLTGCRPDVSPDGKKITWGHGDFAIGVADLDLSASPPTAINIRDIVESKEPMENSHVDWSPDGKYIAFSYGPQRQGRHLDNRRNDSPGVAAPGWNICVAVADGKTTGTHSPRMACPTRNRIG